MLSSTTELELEVQLFHQPRAESCAFNLNSRIVPGFELSDKLKT